MQNSWGFTRKPEPPNDGKKSHTTVKKSIFRVWEEAKAKIASPTSFSWKAASESAQERVSSSRRQAREQWLDVNSLYTLNKMYGGNPQIPNGLHFIAFQNPVFQSCVCSNAATVKLLPSYDGITSKVHLIKVLLLCSLLYGLYQMATTKEDWKQILSVEYFYDAVALSRYSIYYLRLV